MTDRTAGPAVPLRRTPARPAAAPPDIAQANPAGAVPGGLGSRSIPAPTASNKLAQQRESGVQPAQHDERAEATATKRRRRSGRRLKDRSDAGLLAELRRAAALIAGATLPRTAFDRVSLINSDAISRRFGGWDRALARAGLRHRDCTLRSKRTQRLTDRQVLDRLRRAATPDGVVTLQAVGRSQGLFKSTFVRRFGSWPAAVRRAGLHLSPNATCGPRPKRTPAEKRAISATLRFKVLKRDDYRCQLCGDSPAISRGTTLEVDHIHPFSQGGPTTEDNLRTLCRRCNQGKGATV